MHTVPGAHPHASAWQSFLPYRQQTSATASTRVHAETRTNADITIMTAAGDKVTLSANTVLQTAYASYDAQGRMTGQRLDVHADAWQFGASHESAVTVEGHVDDEELADIHLLLENLGTMVTDFLEGDLDDAVTPALDLGNVETLAGFDATFEYVQHVRVEQQYTAQGSWRETPAGGETSPSSPLISLKSIEPLLASMMQAAEASQVAAEPLVDALPQFTAGLMDQLTSQQGAEAPKSKLAAHLLATFASYFETLAAAAPE